MIFKELLEAEQLTILQCMRTMLDGKLLDDVELQSRLGINKQELLEVVDAWPQLNDADSTSNTSLAINNCLNEICYGISIDDDTLIKRYGVSRQAARYVLDKWRNPS